MSFPENKNYRLPPSTFSEESPELLFATQDYLSSVSLLIGRIPSSSELGKIAQRSAAILASHQILEQQPEKVIQETLRNWGIVHLNPNILRMNGREIEITPTEFRLFKIFASSTGHLLTFTDAKNEFGWENPKSNLWTNIDRIRQKLKQTGNSSFKITAVKNVGYRIDLAANASTLDPGGHLPPQNPTL